jgi:hypothetical protein
MRTLTFTISDQSKFPGILQRILTLRGMNLALSGVPAQIAFSPTNFANEIVQIIADCGGFEETIESGKSISFPLGLEKYLAGEGLEGTLELQLDSMLTRALTKGAVTARDMYKLESYPKDDPALPPGLGDDLIDYIEKAVDFAKSILTEGGRIVRAAVAINGLRELIGLRFSPSGADLDVDGTAEPTPFSIQLLGYKYRPLTEPIGDFIQDPADVEGRADGPHYGVGGFFNFAPVERQLNAPAPLTIYWEPHEIAGFDESTLAIYRWNRDRLDWDYVGGTVDAAADSVTTTVTRLGLYTAAPPLPVGALTFSSTFERSGTETEPTTRATFVSAPIAMNTGAAVPDGTLFTVRLAVPSASEIVPFGQMLTPDADPAIEGIQIPAQAGVVTFSADLPGPVGAVVVIANATRGTALGEQTVVYQRPQ